MAERRYSDQDVAFILKRAAALEERRSQVESPRGITLRDLREIAQEVGIDPALVDEAAAELDHQGSRTARAVATETARVREIRSVPRLLEPPEVREVLGAVDRATPDQGIVSEAAGEVRWTSGGALRVTQLSIRPVGDETVISVEESLANTRGPLLGFPTASGAVFGLLIGAEGGSVGTALMVGLLLAVAGFFVGGGIWQLVLDHHIRRARSLMDAAVRAAQGPVLGASATPPALGGPEVP
jgi:hypothetical protein